MSTKAYAQSLKKMAKDRQLKMLTKKDKESLIKLAQLMQRANEDVSFRDKLSAHGSAMDGLQKYMNMLKKIPAPKKSKAVQKLAMQVQKMFAKKDESTHPYGVGDIVKDVNPTCPHCGAMGRVQSMNPKSVVFVVMNKGKNYKPGDVLDKTHDQMEIVKK